MSNSSSRYLNIYRLFFPDLIIEIKGEILVIDDEYTSNILSVTTYKPIGEGGKFSMLAFSYAFKQGFRVLKTTSVMQVSW